MILAYYIIAIVANHSLDTRVDALHKVEAKLISSSEMGCVVNVPPCDDELFILVGVPPSGKVKCIGGEVVNQDMWIRRHRISRICVPPGNYNRRVEISWEASKGVLGLPEQTAFEDVLSRHLVNYETAKYWVRSQKLEVRSQKSDVRCKLLTIQDGIYRVEYDDIVPILPELIGADPRTIKVTWRDFELPIVVKGEEDGKFDPADWIEFYSFRKSGGSTYLDLYSDTNVYWVSFGGTYGARLVKESGVPGNALIPDSFQCLMHFEHDSIYRLFNLYPDTIDPWFWAEFSSAHQFQLETPAPAQLGESRLKIELYATSVDSAGECNVYLNNNNVGVINYPPSRGVPVIFETSFTQSLLQPSNLLRLEPSRGSICLNSIELSYFKRYEAHKGGIKFIAPTSDNYKFKIDGFVNPGIRVWKLGTSVIVDGRIEYNAALGTYTYTFEDKAETSPAPTYVAQDYILKPLGIRKVESDLLSPLNRADYIIITNQPLHNCGLTYASWKESQGFTCKVVDVQEIYDDFNFGLADPVIIRAFLQYAFEVWQLPPVYVLLLGDASYDHRDILGFGESIVPTQNLYDANRVLIPSDNLYACISGDDPIPDLFIARLPVRNEVEFNIVFDKLRGYESVHWVGEWRKNLIFGTDLEGNPTTQSIMAKYVSGEFESYYLCHPPSSQPEMIDAINKGAILLSYIGHSGTGEWAGGLLWREAVPGLMNANRLPFISVLGCYNALFDRPGDDGMAELFIKCPGGGIAYWGPTGSLYTSDCGLVEGPIEAMFTNRVNTPGSLGIEGIIKCFKERRTPKTVLQQILLGDPSTKIYTPQPDIDLTVIPPSLHPGDSVTIFGKLPVLSAGSAVSTIYLPDSVPFKKLFVPVSNGAFCAGFRLPDTVAQGTGSIKVYVDADTLDFVGRTTFSILTPNIYPVELIPAKPTYQDSVLIKAKVFDEAGIEWVRCGWSLNPPPWSIIEMELDTSGYYITKSRIPPNAPLTKVDFKIECRNWNGELFSACSSYKVLSLPELRVYSVPKLGGKEQVLISTELVNDGDQLADSFEVAFYGIVEHRTQKSEVGSPLSSDTILLGMDTIAIKGRDYEFASVPWNLKQGKALIVIDPYNKVHESDETNNSFTYNIPVTFFNVTPQVGTDGWVSSLDSRLRCRIDSNSVQSPTVLELKDTLSSYLARFRVEDALLLKPMELEISPDSFYPGLSIYRWCPDYSHWLFVNSGTFALTTTLGVFSLLMHTDTTAPTIKFSLKDDTTFYVSGDTIALKIECIISDDYGIDIVERKPTISCKESGSGDPPLPVPDSLYSYPNDSSSLYRLPLVLRKTFAVGDYVLTFRANDFNGNMVEKSITLHIKPLFGPVEKYCWGNYPNPVRGERTRFYFEFTDVPDEFRVELYTVSGRFLRSFYPKPDKKIEFYWDLNVQGKPCANGVYFYRVFARKGEEELTRILKLAILK